VEAVARNGEPYGFERFRSDLGRLAPDAGDSADALLRTLLVHWRETVGEGRLEDDTTVVVIRREA
jgi:serine phosphatase RsbU (regulator of sigma subunit)